MKLMIPFLQPQVLSHRAAVSEGRPLSWLSWKYSLLLPLALVAILATAVIRGATGPETMRVAVRDGLTGQAVAGAEVRLGDQAWTADGAGVVELPAPQTPAELTVSAPDYNELRVVYSERTRLDQTLQLRTTTLRGVVTDEASGGPLADAAVTLLDGSGNTLGSAISGADGRFALPNAQAGAQVQVDAGDRGTVKGNVDPTMQIALAVKQTRAVGRVLSADGTPIQGALVMGGSAPAVSKGDGTYRLEDVGEGSEVHIIATGYEAASAKVSGGRVADIALQAQLIKAVYANSGVLGQAGGIDRLIRIADTTEINAIVVDIKEGTIFYDSQVPFFREVGTVNPIYDARSLLTTLKEHNIYVIARLVVFQDPLVAEARPDLAVIDEETGDLWRNEMGVAWVNAFEEELWDANIALAAEAVELGFDEVQYDYVRFPSDGDVTTADFGQEYTAEKREAAITAFVKRSSEAVHNVGGRLAADLFGYITLVNDEQWIGQKFSELEPYLDVVSMMIYPSHFSEGNIASAPGHPNDYPYETILESLQRAEEHVPGAKLKFRPWLQDFDYNYGGLRDYEPDDVRAQIDAAEDFGAGGWMLWGDPFNVTVEALKTETARHEEVTPVS